MKKSIITLIISVLLLIPQYNVNALNTELEETYRTEENKVPGEPYLNPKWVEWNNLPDEEKSKWEVIPQKLIVDYIYEPEKPKLYETIINKYNLLAPKVETLPSKYNLKDDGYVSPIKNQGSLGLCWAFATVGAVESNALKTLGKSLIFSERQIDYAVSNPATSITEGYNPYGNSDQVLGNGGGWFYLAADVFRSGISPVFTSTWGSYSTSTTKKQNLSKVINNDNVKYHVTDTVDFPYLDMEYSSEEEKAAYRKMIKEHIMEYGGVYVSTIVPDSRSGSCYKSSYNMIYQTSDCTFKDENPYHAMLVIGWNDTYGPDNDGDGVGDGAWILKNSWGTSDHPYPYLSYNSIDVWFNGVISIKEKDWDNNYDFTDLSTTKTEDKTITTTYYKDMNNNEQLQRVSFWNSYHVNMSYNVYVRNVDDNKTLIGSINVKNPGTYSIDVDNVELQGDNFQIIIESSISGYKATEVVAFTKNKTTNTSVSASTQIINDYVSLDKSTEISSFKIYTTTNEIESGKTLEYKIYNSANEEITDLFAFSNYYVINDSVLSDLTFNSVDIEFGNYKIETYYNDMLLNIYDFEIGQVRVSEIKSSITDIKMLKGRTKNLSITVSPGNAANKSLKWESSDNSIITLQNKTTNSANTSSYSNTITAIGKGTATITISTVDGSNLISEVTVNVAELEGDGTLTNPFKIKDKYDFDNIRLDLKANYELTNDIVFSDKDFESGGEFYNNGKGWIPIGTFQGTLNGNNYSIKNVKRLIQYSSGGSTGLFSRIEYGTIKNLILENISIENPDDAKAIESGILTGDSYSSVFENININNSTINVKSSKVGGLSGNDYASKFINCNNNSTIITSGGYVGGIVGYSSYSIYNNVKNTGQITGSTVGGISGYIKYGQAINLVNSGNIIGISDSSGSGGTIGGLLGSISYSTTLLSSYNEGNITIKSDGSYTGGIIGGASSSTIMDVYNIGKITFECSTVKRFGGAIASSSSNYIKRIFVKSTVEGNPTYDNRGTFIGYSSGDEISTYYYSIDSWNYSSIGGNDLNNLSTSSTSLTQISDKEYVCKYLDCNNIWEKSDDSEYPTLRMNDYEFEIEIKIPVGSTEIINLYPFNQLPSRFYNITNPDDTIASLDVSKGLTGKKEGYIEIVLKRMYFSKTIKVTVTDFDIETNKYNISDNLIIPKIKDKLLFNDFITDFTVNSNVDIKVFNDAAEIDYAKPLGTGHKLKTYSNDKLKNEYTLVVSGDINGDGQANATDIIFMKSYILGKNTLEGILFTAGDVNENNSVNATDIMYLKRYILGKSDNVWGNS